MAPIKHFLVLLVLILIGGTVQLFANGEKKGWLSEEWPEARNQVQDHLRGTDVAMLEVGHRFRELYFAGKDMNWDYADYQLEKIGKVVELAAERRPKRAKSANVFLKEDLPDVVQLVKERSPASFDTAMNRLRTSCMKCHVAENVPYFAVRFPQINSSVIKIHDKENEEASA